MCVAMYDMTIYTGILCTEPFSFPHRAETDESWQSVTQGLAGLLCASLNFIQPENTGKPVMLFGAEGSDGRLGAGSPYRYATLSRENVCTENLTPLVKLLPCRAKAGLASMMNAYTVFDSLFSALSVHVSTECVDDTCEYKKQVLVLAVNVVPTRVNQEPSQPLPKQYHWNLGDLLKAALNSACAVATNSEVKIVTTDWLGVKRITLNKAPSHTVEHGVYAIDVYPVVFGEGSRIV
ncbi:hypothetical protein SARC_04822 [Sphaeroforma arctica JP610]|uniref:Uncharacterized protein n=1 Tax=Sphaeroforma arctica JP610 TaxID=667725 RepID=A0A0L0G175_9EUKA|nr:hypothetical protein SARC_04822 [Sphaeroforma arctica JP610]KNC82902.1 hypothetical protein SARC_04822 [Sphaeroforma arctica JP610]|eukprot:XP_014156804.1 hypothetical protein SARC_04822 [Sphaeroforma arctica JP610]